MSTFSATSIRYALSTIQILAVVVQAQPFDTLWSRTYGGDSDEECRSIIRASDGGFVLAGSSNAGGAFGEVPLLIKTNMAGDSLWSRAFVASSNSSCNEVMEATGRSFVGVCSKPPFAPSTVRAAFFKVSPDGDSLWSRTFGNTSYGGFHDIAPAPQGGYILAGFHDVDGELYFSLVRTDDDGLVEWNRLYSPQFNYSVCYSLDVTSDGGYILGGVTSWGEAWDIWLLKTDEEGDSMWSRTNGGASDDYCFAVIGTADGGYLLGGYTQSFGAGGRDIWLIKTDSAGDSLWSRTYGGQFSELCYSLQADSVGGYLVSGSTGSFGSGAADFWLLKVDSNGDSTWSRTYGGSHNEVCYSALLLSADRLVLAGYTEPIGGGSTDFWLVDTWRDLSSPWRFHANPDEMTLGQNFPNPFNSTTEIRFELPHSAFTEVKVFDLLGREVAALVNKTLEAGTHHVYFDAESLPSGLYFYRLRAGEFLATKKMLLLK